jgi:hypothetical protein
MTYRPPNRRGMHISPPCSRCGLRETLSTGALLFGYQIAEFFKNYEGCRRHARLEECEEFDRGGKGPRRWPS